MHVLLTGGGAKPGQHHWRLVSMPRAQVRPSAARLVSGHPLFAAAAVQPCTASAVPAAAATAAPWSPPDACPPFGRAPLSMPPPRGAATMRPEPSPSLPSNPTLGWLDWAPPIANTNLEQQQQQQAGEQQAQQLPAWLPLGASALAPLGGSPAGEVGAEESALGRLCAALGVRAEDAQRVAEAYLTANSHPSGGCQAVLMAAAASAATSGPSRASMPAPLARQTSQRSVTLLDAQQPPATATGPAAGGTTLTGNNAMSGGSMGGGNTPGALSCPAQLLAEWAARGAVRGVPAHPAQEHARGLASCLRDHPAMMGMAAPTLAAYSAHVALGLTEAEAATAFGAPQGCVGRVNAIWLAFSNNQVSDAGARGLARRVLGSGDSCACMGGGGGSRLFKAPTPDPPPLHCLPRRSPLGPQPPPSWIPSPRCSLRLPHRWVGPARHPTLHPLWLLRWVSSARMLLLPPRRLPPTPPTHPTPPALPPIADNLPPTHPAYPCHPPGAGRTPR